VSRPGEKYTRRLIKFWAAAKKTPKWPSSFEIIARVEKRYRLPKNHFSKLLNPEPAKTQAIHGVSANQQHIMQWHLPEDFDSRTATSREEVLVWIRQNVLTGATDFGKYIREVVQTRYSVRFPNAGHFADSKQKSTRYKIYGGADPKVVSLANLTADIAPPRLGEELDDLVRFKRATIAPGGLGRMSGWSEYTAETKRTFMVDSLAH
jgi:hypothetical protein